MAVKVLDASINKVVLIKLKGGKRLDNKGLEQEGKRKNKQTFYTTSRISQGCKERSVG